MASDDRNVGGPRPTEREDNRGPRPTEREDVPGAAGDRAPSADLMSLLVAQAGEGWEVERQLLSSGNEADIFVFVNADNDRIAAKLYRAGVAPKPEVLEALSQQRSLSHVVRLRLHGQIEHMMGRERQHRHFELLEYIENGSLDVLVRDARPLTDPLLRTIIRQLTDAIAHVHSLKLVHRDLKPSNVLVRSREPLNLVLADFGISSLMGDATRRYTSRHRTVMYAAPETGAEVSYASDWWSLGMIVLELVNENHPFARLDDDAIRGRLAQIAVDDLVIGVDEPWRSLCRGLLRRDSRARWGCAEIDRWLAGDRTIPIADEGPPSAPARRPYMFIGVAHTELVTVAAAMRANWTSAEGAIASGDLSAWVMREFPDTGLGDLLRGIETVENPLDWRISNVIARLDATAPLRLRELDLNAAGLRDAAAAAYGGDARAQASLANLFALQLLPEAPFASGHAWRSAAWLNWTAQMEAYSKFASNGAVPESARRRAQEHMSEARAALLLTSFPGGESSTDIASLRVEARKSLRRVGRGCDWYDRLGTAETAGPAALVLMVLWSGNAATVTGEQTRRRQEEERRGRNEFLRRLSVVGIVLALVAGGGFFGLRWWTIGQARNARIDAMATGAAFFEGAQLLREPAQFENGNEVTVRIDYERGDPGEDVAEIEFFATRSNAAVALCSDLQIVSSEGELVCTASGLAAGDYLARLRVRGRAAGEYSFHVGDGQRIYSMTQAFLISRRVSSRPEFSETYFEGVGPVGLYVEYQNARDTDALSLRLYRDGQQRQSCRDVRPTRAAGSTSCALSSLQPGSYEFKFVVNGVSVRAEAFTVALPQVVEAENSFGTAFPTARPSRPSGPLPSPPRANVAPASDWIESPVWRAEPTRRQLDRAYPERALRLEREGRVQLSCFARRDGRLSCTVTSEQPDNLGFGAAALEVAEHYRLSQAQRDNTPIAGRPVRMPPIRFSPP